MPADANEPGSGFSAFKQLKAWAAPRLRTLVANPAIQAHRDTVERLLGGDVKRLPPEERARRVEEIIRVSASAAVGMASIPVPFLDLPILVGMVGAIGRVNGLAIADRQLYTQVLTTLGGGLILRQLLRAVPFGGTLYAAQIYGATYALGRVAQAYCTEKAPDASELRRVFEETLAKKAAEHQARQDAGPKAAAARRDGGADSGATAAGGTDAGGTAAGGPVASGAVASGPGSRTAQQRLRELQGLKEQGLVTEQEYQRKREQILAAL